MTSNNLEVYIELEAIKAELEGMKADNQCRLSRGCSISYSEIDFDNVAERMRTLAVQVC